MDVVATSRVYNSEKKGEVYVVDFHGQSEFFSPSLCIFLVNFSLLFSLFLFFSTTAYIDNNGG